MTFNPEDRRWKCLGGRMHITKGAIVFATIGIVVGIFSIVGIFWLVPICILLLYGVRNDRHSFIAPYLIMQTIHVVFAFIVFAWLLYGLLNIEFRTEHRSVEDPDVSHRARHNSTFWGLTMGWMILTVICSDISLLVNVYVWYVVYLTYKFIEEKKAAIAAGVYKEVAPAGPVTVAYRNLPEEPQVFYTQRYTTEPAIELASAAQSQHQRY